MDWKVTYRLTEPSELVEGTITTNVTEPWLDPDLQEKVRDILEAIGDNPDREGLQETPKRFLKYMWDTTHPQEFKFTMFDAEGMDQMIVQKNIPFYSTCEHHLATFFGTCVIAYIPNKKMVGLSKLARTVQYFATGLQNQERITSQIADKLMKELKPKGVAVMMQARHMCMEARGVKTHDAQTITSAVRGIFKKSQTTKEEFLKLLSVNV